MENASKALLMAAGVLIGVLILSLVVYLFLSFGSTSAEIHRQNDENQLSQFNIQFTSYEGKSEITIYDVITIANLAKDNNEYYNLTARNEGKDNYISVNLEGIGWIQNKTISYYNELIASDISTLTSENINKEQGVQDLPQYTCQVEISPTTQRVFKVTFKKID